MTKDYSSGASPKLVTFLIKTGGLQFAVPSGGIISHARKVHQRVHLCPGEAMAIHSKEEIRPNLDEQVYGASFLPHPLPKYKFPKQETEPNAAYQLVHDELLLDGNSRQNLATFCQTWVEPEIQKLMDECLGKNLIDKDEYPQTAELESRCVNMLSDLWNSPDAANSRGCSTTGSSEAAMLGALAMKSRWRKKRVAAGKSAAKPNLICGLVHSCWQMFARYFDVELRQIPCEGRRLMMSADEVIKRCDENTIGVVPTLGTTFTLQYEPVQAAAMALDDLEEQHGLDIPMHIDAASGGFIAPFVHPSVVWDFRIPRVKSINASGHKFGLSPLSCGWIVWREAQDLPEELVFNVKYLGGNMRIFSLNFSRPAGQVVAQYYNFVRLGREGYTKITQGCSDVASWFADQVRKLDMFDLIHDGRSGIPGCAWTLKPDEDAGFTLYDLSNQLRIKGWQVPTYPLPPNRTDVIVQRVLMRLGVSRDLAGLLINDLQRAIGDLEKTPPRKSLTRTRAGGYSHS
jgi:glutamate decarboxylase